MGARWVRVDAGYFTNPKALMAGRDGRDLHLASICWVGAHLTDGVIPEYAVETILRAAGVSRRAIERVVAAGLWIPNGSASFELHDYLAMNPARAEVERERAKHRDRQRRYAAKRWENADDASPTPARRVTDAVTDDADVT